MKDYDDVATAISDLKMGTEIVDSAGRFHVILKQDIPFGHKFAIRRIERGQPVHKYGEVIGTAVRDIEQGEHVHTQNVESRRGRGDLLRGQA